MQIVKCPRCDINFMREDEQCCKICKRDLKGSIEKNAELEICVECGEGIALPGEELCAECLNEQRKMMMDSAVKQIVKRKTVDETNDDEEDTIPIEAISARIPDDDLEESELDDLDIDIVDETDDDIVDLDDEDILDLSDEDDFADDPLSDDEFDHDENREYESRKSAFGLL